MSKTRYRFIGGEWVGGDIEKGLYTPFRSRNYEEDIERYVVPRTANSYEEYHYRQYAFVKEDIHFNELFYLSTRNNHYIKARTARKRPRRRSNAPSN